MLVGPVGDKDKERRGESDMADKQRLGELLVEQRLVSRETIDQALRAQVGGTQRLGSILVRMKAISEDQLAETLSRHLDTPIITVGEHFSPTVRKMLPRYLCKQYGVIPLAEKDNNVLELAMANPADVEARNDLEHYTGKVILPTLARSSDISAEIPRRIPVGLADFFSPRASTRLTRIGVVGCLVLTVILGGMISRYISSERYGSVSVTGESTVYSNHDLVVGVERSGKIDLVGRGAYAKGYYAASFSDGQLLAGFVNSRQADFSAKQRQWLEWVMANKLPVATGQSLAAK